MARPGVESVSGSLIHLAELPAEGLSEVELPVAGDLQSILLRRTGARVQAWLNICPHAGRRMDYAPGKFLLDQGRLVCAAHGASFELEQGVCVAGPCRGASLVPLEVVVG
ncbi:MAG: ferredoxin [Lysobacteraceae bacterium]|nr:MAG: ferredoxin [Xanthomonadaceae bacterium]